jgi:two-component system, response regulator YesN
LLEGQNECLYPLDLEKKMITLFKQGESEAGFQYVDNFLHSVSRLEESADSIRFAIGEMLVQLFRQLREVKSLPVPSKVMETFIEEIQCQETFVELAEKSKELIKFILHTVALEGMTLSFAAKGVEYMKLKLNRDISLQEVADYVGISPSYFSVLFKQENGVNFVDFLVRLRMEKSFELLEKTGFTVARIGDEVGYRTYRYFSKVFKDYYGMTPTQFRDRLKQL